MNTLNYKVLLIKIVLVVFIRAIGIYLLMTIPALGVPVIYLLSAGYAISFGWIAAVFFLFLFYAVLKIKAAILVKNILLYVSVAITVAIAFQMMEITGAQYRIWHSGAFLLLPGFAIISGWISLAVSRHKINSLFVPGNDSYYEAVIGNSISDNEQPSLNKIV
ncbi:MAG TPA: hypothetical protein VK645_17805 [Chitinophagaceae bacterium]|nr:hypothetical protein [Chitinophagaceae bacterium]